MTRRPVLVVDGYNVVHAAEPYSSLAARDLDAARVALVGDVASYAQGAWRCTVVFDGAGNAASDGAPHRVAGVVVVFSAFGTSADSVVEALAARARERGDAVTVVTSDAATQDAVLGEGATRMASREFAAMLAEEAADRAEHAPAGSRRSRVEDALEPSVRERLERWARGTD